LYTRCPPCRNSIPHLSQLQKKYKDKDVVFVGITDENENTARDFVMKMGNQMDYTVVVDSTRTVNKQYMEKYSIQGIPHAFIIGKERKVVWNGHPMESDFESNLQAAANAPKIIALDTKSSKEKLMEYSIKDLKSFLVANSVDLSGCIDKTDLVDLIKSKF